MRTGRKDQVADDSQTSNVASRYAQALFDLAKDQNALAPVEADLASLKTALSEARDLRILLESPAFSSEDKGRGLSAIANAGAFNPTTRKFLGLLAANGRASALGGVITAFEKLAADARGEVQAQVTTAVPLTAAQAKGVAQALRQALGKDPKIETRVDPALLGGIKVRVGSRLFDASLRAKLDSLKFALKRA
jgi:F-type H+-transporting ATPase subunit delta